MTVTALLIAVALAELAGIIALGVLLIVSRRQLKGTRAELERAVQSQNRPAPTAPRGRAFCDSGRLGRRPIR